ncbi:MAG: InlB B-repeat-containing protein [Salinivirgaceae bacterium]
MKSFYLLTLLVTISTWLNSCKKDIEATDNFKTVTYMPNGAEGGTVPIDDRKYDEGDWVKILPNSGNLLKAENRFNGWCTSPDGTGMHCMPDTFIAMGSNNLMLYAQWLIISKYSVLYDANGATNGTVPVDIHKYEEGELVTILNNTGNLLKTDFTFNGWNSKADGSGTHFSADSVLYMGNTDLLLYAEWENALKYITLEVQSPFFRPCMEFGSSAVVYIDYGDGSEVQKVPVSGGVKLFDKYFFTNDSTVHIIKISVKPWDALTVLNLGFRGGDGGNGEREMQLSELPYLAFHPTFEEVPLSWEIEQERASVLNYAGTVISVANLSVAPNLTAFCCEFQPIDSIDLSGCSNSLTLEGFFSSIKTTNFQGCTSMHRCCLENTGAQYNWRIDNGIKTEDEILDLRDCPVIRDIRGTGDNHTMVRLHANAINTIWHLCKMANWRMETVKIGDEEPAKLMVSRFTNLTECWISGSPVIENVEVTESNPNLYSMWLSQCGIKTVDVKNQTQIQVLELSGNTISEINITGCNNLVVITLNDCNLSQIAVDSVLSTLDGFNLQTSNPYNKFDFSGSNSDPSETGMTHVTALRSRGWNVILNQTEK